MVLYIWISLDHISKMYIGSNMMNSPFVRNMADAVGSQMAEEQLEIEQIIQQLYQRVLIREADTKTYTQAGSHYQHPLFGYL